MVRSQCHFGSIESLHAHVGGAECYVHMVSPGACGPRPGSPLPAWFLAWLRAEFDAGDTVVYGLEAVGARDDNDDSSMEVEARLPAGGAATVVVI
jgi:hypothetical protein